MGKFLRESSLLQSHSVALAFSFIDLDPTKPGFGVTLNREGKLSLNPSFAPLTFFAQQINNLKFFWRGMATGMHLRRPYPREDHAVVSKL